MAMAVRARSGEDSSFSKKDFRDSNVGPDRIREIIRNVIYQVDPKYADNPALAQKVAGAVNAIVKEFKYVKYVPGVILDEEGKQEEASEYIGQLKLCNENLLSVLINRANIELIHFEQSIRMWIKDLIKDSSIRIQDIREKRRHENYVAEINDFDREKLIQEARLKVYRDIELAKLNLNNLISHRDNLIIAIEEDKKTIQSSRNYRSKNIAVYAKELRVGNVKSFEGMSDEQVDSFTKGRLKILEAKIRSRIEYERKIQAMVDAEINRLQPKSLQEKHNIEQRVKAKEGYHEKIALFDQEEFNAIRDLGHYTGHQYINHTVPAETAKAHMSAYDNDKGIKHETDIHAKVAEFSIQNIIINEAEKERTENEIKEDAIPKVQVAIKKGKEERRKEKEGISEKEAATTILKGIDENVINEIENNLIDMQDTLDAFADFDSDELFGLSNDSSEEIIQTNPDLTLGEEDKFLYEAKNISDLDFSGPTLKLKNESSSLQMKPN